MFKKQDEVKMVRIDPRKERTADHFDPKPIPSRIALQRPWPRISGSEDRLRYAIGHLRRVAAAGLISLRVLDEGLGEAGRYDSTSTVEDPNGCIYLARELLDDAALYAWVLAHELGHALDPRFALLGAEDYHDPRYHGDYEIVADTIARHSLESFGLIIDDYEGYLDIKHRGWRRRINGQLRDRIYAASSHLCQPRPPGSKQAKRRAWMRRRALQRARAEARQDQENR